MPYRSFLHQEIAQNHLNHTQTWFIGSEVNSGLFFLGLFTPLLWRKIAQNSKPPNTCCHSMDVSLVQEGHFKRLGPDAISG